MFKIDRDAIFNREWTWIDESFHKDLDYIEQSINEAFGDQASQIVQKGNVVVLRYTDVDRKSSSFKAANYLGKWNDMNNVNRFLHKMVRAGHSYEPIRGEHVLFMFLGTAKPVYDHLVTYGIGRDTRIAAGQRANKAIGFQVPFEAKNKKEIFEKGVRQVKEVNALIDSGKEQMQVARSLYPVGYIMPPFLLGWSEEALVNIFRQRIWESGAQGATKAEVHYMWEAVRSYDPEKWDYLRKFNDWKKHQATLMMVQFEEKGTTLREFINKLLELKAKEMGYESANGLDADRFFDIMLQVDNMTMYEALINTYCKPPRSMWDK